MLSANYSLPNTQNDVSLKRRKDWAKHLECSSGRFEGFYLRTASSSAGVSQLLTDIISPESCWVRYFPFFPFSHFPRLKHKTKRYRMIKAPWFRFQAQGGREKGVSMAA